MQQKIHSKIEVLRGTVSRITYHNADNGWSVLRLEPEGMFGEAQTVTVHQTQVFAGATMEFHGKWTNHPQYGRQFKADRALEKKPASAAALEKYLGSGLIKGIGPKTAKRIVAHFGEKTLDTFEHHPERLLEVPGIAKKKLDTIRQAWSEHRMIRDVMIFLQGHHISTLFAVRIFKKYGDQSIKLVQENPYRLASDFYGIGFLSADKVALSLGHAENSVLRIVAGIRHILASSRDEGHCYLTISQIRKGTEELLGLHLAERLETILKQMEEEKHLCMRKLVTTNGDQESCYYSKTLYYDEITVARKVSGNQWIGHYDEQKITQWMNQYLQGDVKLSEEQADAVKSIVQNGFSVLTGGPGCGKTTTTLAIVRLFDFLGRKVVLAAPTGRAAQRMGEVIGREAKTIHRLLEWQGTGFQCNEDRPLQADVLIVDECSMLDISLTASLVKALPQGCQCLFIGDADQLPSVGAGNVLQDIICSNVVACYRLTKIFRQAQKSKIISYAHDINKGTIPKIESPFKTPALWKDGTDCIFLDSEEASQEQLSFISRTKRYHVIEETDPYNLNVEGNLTPYGHQFTIPDKFSHVNLDRLVEAKGGVEELKSVLKKVHPWSSLHYGLNAVDSVRRLYTEWIPKYFGKNTEIQILSPMTRGSLGTLNLNKVIQEAINPAQAGRSEMKVGEKIFRVGDRIIHKRNNYDLNVFNGDIGKIIDIDTENLSCLIYFSSQERDVEYSQEHIMEIDLAYAITIHKSQGSEFTVTIIPVLTQHFTMLYRNLIYTGLTRAKKMAVIVGNRRALSMAVRREDSRHRQTALQELLQQQMGLFTQ